jgi:chemotaxis protein CheC
MDDVRELKARQLDALKEVANIGGGHAATALSTMTNRRVMISVPRVNVVRLEEVPDLIGAPNEVVAAVLMHMLGDLTGRTLLLFPEPVSLRLCDMLLRRPAGGTTALGTLEQSALKEAGNILSGAYMNALSEPGGGHVRGRPHHDVPQLRARPRFRLLRGDRVPHRR